MTKLHMVVVDVGGFDWSRPAAGGYPIKKSCYFVGDKIDTGYALIVLKFGYGIKLILN